MWRSAGMAWALGFEIIACFLIGGVIGYFLDRFFKTRWIMYLGLFFGLGAAIKAIVRVVNVYKRENETEDRKTGGGGAGAN